MLRSAHANPIQAEKYNIYIHNYIYIYIFVVGSKCFRPDQLFRVTEIKQLCCFSTQSPFISTHFSTDTLTSPQMVLYIPHSIFRLARLLYVRPEAFGLYYVYIYVHTYIHTYIHTYTHQRRVGEAVEQLVETLRYKLEGRGF